jgi:hypothetical protein
LYSKSLGWVATVGIKMLYICLKCSVPLISWCFVCSYFALMIVHLDSTFTNQGRKEASVMIGLF